MPNRGIVPGLKSEVGWQTFDRGNDMLRAFAASGTPTQPALNSATIRAGYTYDRQTGTVVYEGAIQFASDTTFGSSDHVWGLLLPVPAFRSLGGADLPIGNGFAWQGSAGNRNMGMRATLMDPLIGGGGNNSNEDYYAQFFVPYLLASGTATLVGTTPTTINHNLGMTPVAYDFTIMPTATTTSNYTHVFVDTITSSQANLTCRATPGASNLSVAWKCRAEPNGSSTLDLLLNSQRPFQAASAGATCWASGYVLAWHLRYQARR